MSSGGSWTAFSSQPLSSGGTLSPALIALMASDACSAAPWLFSTNSPSCVSARVPKDHRTSYAVPAPSLCSRTRRILAPPSVLWEIAGHTNGRCARSTDCLVAMADTAAAMADRAAMAIATTATTSMPSMLALLSDGQCNQRVSLAETGARVSPLGRTCGQPTQEVAWLDR